MTSPLGAIGSKGSKKSAQQLTDSTTKSLQDSSRLCGLALLNESLDQDTGSLREALQRKSTSGKKIHQSMELDLISEGSPSTGIQRKIGNPSEIWQKWASSTTFPPTYSYGNILLTLVIIGPYLQLLQIMQNRLQSCEQLLYSGAQLELAKVSEPGKRLVFRLILKIRAPVNLFLIVEWWCGYRGEKHIVVDEFRGVVDVSHVLRWWDRYPVRVETKGGSRPLLATHYWITSNLDPRAWYPDLDEDTVDALLRRLNIIHLT